VVDRWQQSVGAIAAHGLRRAVRSPLFLFVSAFALLVLFAHGCSHDPLSAGSTLGQEDSAAPVGASEAVGALGLWTGAAALVGLVLGASAVSSDLRSPALEAAVPRSVPKPAYLLGRWLGLQTIVLALAGAGAVLSFFVLHLARLDPSPILWVGLAQRLVGLVLLTTLALVLGSWLHPLIAGILALLVVTLPGLAMPYLEHSAWLLRWLSTTVYYAGPAVSQDGLISAAFSQAPLDQGYQLPLLVALENGLYALAVLGVALLRSRQREIRRKEREPSPARETSPQA